jgi:hypothetical protein
VFDFALIDGQHGWPMVLVDFYYVNYVVRPGGFIMLDDTQLYSVNELVKLLREQPGYEVALDMGKVVVFRKTAARTTGLRRPALHCWTHATCPLVDRYDMTARTVDPQRRAQSVGPHRIRDAPDPRRVPLSHAPDLRTHRH